MTLNKIGQYFDGFFDAIEQGEELAEYKTAMQLIIEFGQYVDMAAAASPHRFHHVYEWNQVGSMEGRLFELTAVPSPSGTIITYSFKQSAVPNDNGVVFANKAQVMESGDVVTVNTDKPVPIDDGQSFRVGQFTFTPGGADTNGAFRETFMLYFASRTNLVNRGNTRLRGSALNYNGGYKDGMKVYASIVGE